MNEERGNKNKQGMSGEKGNDKTSPSRSPKDVEPIKSGVKAEPHTAVYKMHRYFARRPYNVFRHLIEHYTNEGDIILDPFCGGGEGIYVGIVSARLSRVDSDVCPVCPMEKPGERQGESRRTRRVD